MCMADVKDAALNVCFIFTSNYIHNKAIAIQQLLVNNLNCGNSPSANIGTHTLVEKRLEVYNNAYLLIDRG